MRNVILFIFFILLISPILSSYAQPPAMGTKPWGAEAQCLKASELNLSQEQMKGLDALQQAFFREAQLLRIQLFSKRLELRELLTNPTTKIEAIRTKSAEILDSHAKVEERSIDYLIKVRGLLTHEQLKNWCPEFEIPTPRRMMQGPGSVGPFTPRKPPLQEGPKPE